MNSVFTLSPLIFYSIFISFTLNFKGTLIGDRFVELLAGEVLAELSELLLSVGLIFCLSFL